mmetsp:Transcript_19094/g.44647  ORF Transcript_19094/g.44647 Transcript_19094/m.44647 type:complete len:591 (-) Transcript_19094:81-1853(-)
MQTGVAMNWNAARDRSRSPRGFPGQWQTGPAWNAPAMGQMGGMQPAALQPAAMQFQQAPPPPQPPATMAAFAQPGVPFGAPVPQMAPMRAPMSMMPMQQQGMAMTAPVRPPAAVTPMVPMAAASAMRPDWAAPVAACPAPTLVNGLPAVPGLAPPAFAHVQQAGMQDQQQLQQQQEQQQQLQKQQEAAAAEAERQSVESGSGYFEPPMDYVISGGSQAYRVVSPTPLGVGVFSSVWQVANAENKLIALKAVRKQEHFQKYALKEVQILERMQQLADQDAEGSSNACLLREHFMHGPHLCMAFEKLSGSLRDIGKLSLDKVLAYSRQLLLALRFLHDVVGLVHCDVKPDNLLLRHDRLAVKLCDFGTARMVDAPDLQATDELQPLFYRAPEVFVGAPRGRKIDVWSAGCTIYELTVGRILFRSCNTHREVVEQMMKLRGPIPESVREKGRLTRAYFSAEGFHPEVGKPMVDSSFKAVAMHTELAKYADFGKSGALTAQEQAKAQLSRLIGGLATISAAADKRKSGPSDSELKLEKLGELVDLCMAMDPAERLSASAAVNHEVLKDLKPPPAVDLQEAPLPQEAPPPLPPGA